MDLMDGILTGFNAGTYHIYKAINVKIINLLFKLATAILVKST